MPKNKNQESLLEILDNILDYLVNNTKDYKVSYYIMSSYVYKTEQNKKLAVKSGSTDFKTIVDDIFSNFDEPFEKIKDLYLATLHLHSEGLIILDSEQNIQITFKGLLYYSKGFVKEYEKQLDDKNRLLNVEKFQNSISLWMLVISLLIMVGSLVAAYYYIHELGFFPPYSVCK